MTEHVLEVEMRKIWQSIFVAGFLGLMVACTSSSKPSLNVSQVERAPQQVEPETAIDTRHEQTFKNLMQAPSDMERERNFVKFLRRQMGFFYIAQDLVQQFDKELDKLYQQKMDNVDDPDQTVLETQKAKLRFAWEFRERNLDEIQYLYRRLLEESGNSKSGYQKAANLTLESMKKFFEDGWRRGDHYAILSLSTSYDGTSLQFRTSGKGKKPKGFDFPKYAKMATDEKVVLPARSQSLKQQRSRESRYVDSDLKKSWNEYQKVRLQQTAAEAAQEREPNTDVLLPSADNSGTITGNKFKPGYWALTFDDGPHPVHTPGMVAAMNTAGFDGTFFWLTKNMKLYKTIVASVGAQQGFNRGSHSYTHANLQTLSEDGLKHEINEAYDGFAEVVLSPPTLFRCPYGNCGANNSSIRKMIAARKMMNVKWNVDSLDWQDLNPSSIFQRTKKQMEVNGRGIVLFHDVHPQSVKAVQLLVDWMRQKPWKVLNMAEMIREETAGTTSPDTSKNFTSP